MGTSLYTEKNSTKFRTKAEREKLCQEVYIRAKYMCNLFKTFFIITIGFTIYSIICAILDFSRLRMLNLSIFSMANFVANLFISRSNDYAYKIHKRSVSLKILEKLNLAKKILTATIVLNVAIFIIYLYWAISFLQKHFDNNFIWNSFDYLNSKLIDFGK